MRRFVIIASAACLLASCTQKEFNKVDSVPSIIEFTAQTEGSRTYADGRQVCWAAEDSISVFGRGFSNAKFTYGGEAGATHGKFSAKLAGPAGFSTEGIVYAAYPYDSQNAIESETINVWFPEYQEYIPDSFGSDCAIMVAASTDDNLQFKNVCGFINVRLYGDCANPIFMVQIDGNGQEKISGDGFVTVYTEADPAVAMSDDAQYVNSDVVAYDLHGNIVLDPSESKAVDIWLAIPPTEFPGGITLTVVDDQYNQFSITSTNPLSIKRGTVTPTLPVEVVFPDDPLLKQYTVYSYDDASAPENAAGWYGKWNYYATDLFGSTGTREYMGTVTISASATPTEGPDSYGCYDEYVYVDGLFPFAVAYGPANGVDTGTCVIEMDVYDGAMYSFNTTTVDEKCTIYTYSAGEDKLYSAVKWYSAFIPVESGIFAFVDVAASDYDFNGLSSIAGGYSWDKVTDMLLIDPQIDPNAAQSASVKASVAKAKAAYAESAREISHIPFADQKDFVKATIDRYNQKRAIDPKAIMMEKISSSRK